MRPIRFPFLIALMLLCMAVLAFGADEWRTFESPDGGKSFTAKVVGVDAAAGTVTVIMKDTTRKVTFALSRLKPEDQEFAKRQAQLVAARSSFRITFNRVQNQKGKATKGDTTTTSYDGFYQIKIGNYSPNTIRNVTVDYILIWREDSFEGMGPEQVVRGSQAIGNIFANGTHQVTTKSVDLKAVFQKGRVETDNRNRGVPTPDGGVLGGATISHKSQRSRDQMVGCIVQISVDGRVVLADASSPPLMKYQDAFILVEEGGRNEDGAGGKGKDGAVREGK